jgi:hypothetical protein
VNECEPLVDGISGRPMVAGCTAAVLMEHQWEGVRFLWRHAVEGFEYAEKRRLRKEREAAPVPAAAVGLDCYPPPLFALVFEPTKSTPVWSRDQRTIQTRLRRCDDSSRRRRFQRLKSTAMPPPPPTTVTTTRRYPVGACTRPPLSSS